MKSTNPGKNLIITAADKNTGDFAANHWARSLIKEVNLTNCDVVVLDYGLTTAQRLKLTEYGVILRACSSGGFPNSIKFRDIKSVLSEKEYNQVLTCDCGDIIFQDDFTSVFEEHTDSFRGVLQENDLPFEYLFSTGFFDPSKAKEIRKSFDNKKMINAGFFVGPSDKFKQLCSFIVDSLRIPSYGPDQVAASYMMHKLGFRALPLTYNYVICLFVKYPFTVRNGQFYLNDGTLIKVVHNAGFKKNLRIIKDFGYGEEYNTKKRNILISARKLYTSIRNKK